MSNIIEENWNTSLWALYMFDAFSCELNWVMMVIWCEVNICNNINLNTLLEFGYFFANLKYYSAMLINQLNWNWINDCANCANCNVFHRHVIEINANCVELNIIRNCVDELWIYSAGKVSLFFEVWTNRNDSMKVNGWSCVRTFRHWSISVHGRKSP